MEPDCHYNTLTTRLETIRFTENGTQIFMIVMIKIKILILHTYHKKLRSILNYKTSRLRLLCSGFSDLP